MQIQEQRRADYRWSMPIASRWADCDAYGHVNNAVYYQWFDTAITTMLIERGVLRSSHAASIGLCVASGCDFLAPVEFPQTVDAALRLRRIGDKSLTYEVALFLPDEEGPAASGHFVHVFVDPASRRPVPLNDFQKRAVADLVTTTG